MSSACCRRSTSTRAISANSSRNCQQARRAIRRPKHDLPGSVRVERSRDTQRGRTTSRHLDFARCERRSEEHTSELQSLMRISYAVSCLKKNKYWHNNNLPNNTYLTTSIATKNKSPHQH